jgi:dolichol-phosphate mannosyltransferase
LSDSGRIVSSDRYACQLAGSCYPAPVARLAVLAPLAQAPPALEPPRITVVMPARNEGQITAVLDRLLASVRRPAEVLVIVDRGDDPTVRAIREHGRELPGLRCLVNPGGDGAAGAIRYGIAQASAPVIVVTMADGSDDPRQIDELASLVEQGAAVAAASRYAPGGRQVGAPWLKSRMSRLAGRSLQVLARTGTCDATNSFKAYSADFARLAGVQSRHGFAAGLELTAKARRLRLPVAEIPTTWRERTAGRSSFRLARWLPGYLRWYFFCFGRQLQPGQLPGRDLAGRGPAARRLRPGGGAAGA